MEEAIRQDLDERGAATPSETIDGSDFRVDVERWLELVAL
jgi:hypothetical protein